MSKTKFAIGRRLAPETTKSINSAMEHIAGDPRLRNVSQIHLDDEAFVPIVDTKGLARTARLIRQHPETFGRQLLVAMNRDDCESPMTMPVTGISVSYVKGQTPFEHAIRTAALRKRLRPHNLQILTPETVKNTPTFCPDNLVVTLAIMEAVGIKTQPELPPIAWMSGEASAGSNFNRATVGKLLLEQVSEIELGPVELIPLTS